MRKQKGFLDGILDAAVVASGTQTAHSDAPNAPSTKVTTTAAAIIRPEPDALVRSAKGYASEARAHGTRKPYAKHWTAFAAGELVGISGSMHIEIIGGQHFYELSYELAPA